MVGAKAEVIATACTLASRLAALRRLKRAMFSSVLLKACASRTPTMSSFFARRYVPDSLARKAEGAPRTAGEKGGQEQHDRDHREACEGQVPVEKEHRNNDPDEAEQGT
jgi:hypothetical protein